MRVSIADLDFALEWIATYEPAYHEDENTARAKRLCAWLQSEIDRRKREGEVRAVARKLNVSPGTIRRVLRRRGGT